MRLKPLLPLNEGIELQNMLEPSLDRQAAPNGQWEAASAAHPGKEGGGRHQQGSEEDLQRFSRTSRLQFGVVVSALSRGQIGLPRCGSNPAEIKSEKDLRFQTLCVASSCISCS